MFGRMKTVSRGIIQTMRRAFMGSNFVAPIGIAGGDFSMTALGAPDTETLLKDDVEVLLPAKVILYNDQIHTFDEVIVQLVKAAHCSSGQAEEYAHEVHTRGLACVYEGEMVECLKVSGVLEEIALNTAVEL